MDAEGRGLDLRDAVIVGGAIAGVVFALIELTGSDIDKQVAQTGYTSLAVVLFTAFGSVGLALAHWQPRFALIGVVSSTLSLLAAGATVVSVWSGSSSLGFGFSGSSGTVVGITIMLAIASSAACGLLATIRRGRTAARGWSASPQSVPLHSSSGWRYS